MKLLGNQAIRPIAALRGVSFSLSQKNDIDIRHIGSRGICFEQVVLLMEKGEVLDTIEHPNQERYPGQKIAVVIIDAYAYLVPYVEHNEEIFLKTIIPSRKATHKYLRAGK